MRFGSWRGATATRHRLEDVEKNVCGRRDLKNVMKGTPGVCQRYSKRGEGREYLLSLLNKSLLLKALETVATTAPPRTNRVLVREVGVGRSCGRGNFFEREEGRNTPNDLVTRVRST